MNFLFWKNRSSENKVIFHIFHCIRKEHTNTEMLCFAHFDNNTTAFKWIWHNVHIETIGSIVSNIHTHRHTHRLAYLCFGCCFNTQFLYNPIVRKSTITLTFLFYSLIVGNYFVGLSSHYNANTIHTHTHTCGKKHTKKGISKLIFVL